jgi:hypothetical protein
MPDHRCAMPTTTPIVSINAPEWIGHTVDEARLALRLPPATACERGGTWHVAFDDATCFDIQYDERGRRIMITGNVGIVAEPARAQIYPTLLQYNFIWQQTGGVRMALDPATEQVVAMFELPASGLGPSHLSQALSSMAGVRRAWAEILLESANA